jgi:hypothetical protein
MYSAMISIFTKSQNLRTYFAVYILYALILDISLWFVAEAFAYEGYIYRFDAGKTLFSYGLALSLIFLHLRYSSSRISGMFCQGIFCLFVLPLLIYFMRSDSAYSHAVLVVSGYVCLLLCCHFLARVPLKISFRGNRYIFYGSIAFLSIGTYALLFHHFRIQFNLDLSSVYETRDHFIQNMNPLLGYMVIWQGNIINPLLFYLAVNRKKYLFIFMIIFFQAYLFGVTGMKIFAFSLFFAYLLARFSEHLRIFLPVSLMAVVAVSCLLYWYQGNVWPIGLFVRRTLFTPSQLTFEYFDFFSQNPLVFLSDSLFKRFLSYPYPLPPQLMIGIRYYEGASANVGIFGNSYMHFGALGIFLFLSILSIFLVFFDKMVARKSENSAAFVAMVATPIVSLINSGFFTVLLTHGLFLSIFLAFFVDFSNVAENRSKKSV